MVPTSTKISYNAERPHQGIGNELIQPPTEPPLVEAGEVVADERLGGLLRSYRRAT